MNNNDNKNEFNLQLYLDRINYSGEIAPTAKVLHDIHLAHATSIPFENLDIYSGKPVKLDFKSLYNKLILSKRGGYCFEQNLLFAYVLEKIGFNVKRLAARVRYGATRILPRTHMMIIVETENKEWLADVGFGGDGLLLPVPFVLNKKSIQFNWTYKIVKEKEHWILQSLKSNGWIDLYAFTLEKQEQTDYELANYYTSTHPDSKFVQSLTVQKSSPKEKKIIRSRELIIDNGSKITERNIEDSSELIIILENEFNLKFDSNINLKIKKKFEL